MNSKNKKRSPFLYGLWKFLANVVSVVIFRRKYLRNEIKNKKGPMVIIANHQAALDFVNLIGATKAPMSFVISNSFYHTIPLKGIMSRLGLIPKQQFQTTLSSLRKMKHALDAGEILVIYPAGLMSDDGRSTPLPVGTYCFLRWVKADVYMAKTIGTYFSMPKWRRGGMRAGRTYIDIYKLFDKEELKAMSEDELRRRTDEALLFDAYEEQESYRVKYQRNDDIEGLENVLYICPSCKKEFTVRTRDKSTIYCESCGFEEKADKYQMLHKTSDVGDEIRHPSKWNAMIHDLVKEQIESGELSTLSSRVEIHMIPEGKSCFKKVGDGILTLTKDSFSLSGVPGAEEAELIIPITSFAALPYKPGEYIEVQSGETIYRCFTEDGRLVIKFINMIKIFYEINTAEAERKKHARRNDWSIVIR